LALLSIYNNRPVERAHLAREIWPKDSGDPPLNRLASALYLLKKSIIEGGGDPDQFLECTRTSIRLRTERIELDIEEFFRCIQTARIAEDHETKREAYLMARIHYRGPLLQGYSSPWAVSMRLQAQQDIQEAITWLSADFLARGLKQEAMKLLTESVMTDPTSLAACESCLMTMAARGGLETAASAAEVIHRFLVDTGSMESAKRISNLLSDWRVRLISSRKVEQIFCVLAADHVSRETLENCIGQQRGRPGRNYDFGLFLTPGQALAAARAVMSRERKARIVLTIAVMDHLSPLPNAIRPALRKLPLSGVFCSMLIKPLLKEADPDLVMLKESIVEGWQEVIAGPAPSAPV
jgi:DNA-binding SARP family transcriptional activator